MEQVQVDREIEGGGRERERETGKWREGSMVEGE